MVNLYHAWSPVDMPDEMSENQDATADQDDAPSDFAVVFGYFIHMLPYINCTGYPILYTLLNRQIIDAYRAGGRARSVQHGRDSITRTSNGMIAESVGSRNAPGRSSRYGSGNSQLLRVGSFASIVGLNGEIETSLSTSTRRLTSSPSAISTV